MVETGMICPDCDGLISFCDHALKRLTDPVLAYQGKVIGELQDDLAEQRARADAALMALARVRELLSPYGAVMCLCTSGPCEPWCAEVSTLLTAPERGAALLAAADAMAEALESTEQWDGIFIAEHAKRWRALGRGGC